MVKLLRLSFYTAFFLFMLTLFLPKENIYYFIKNELAARYTLYVTEKNLKEELFGLSVADGEISYDEVDIARFQALDIQVYLFVNTVNLHKIELSSLVANYFPKKIEVISFEYSLLNPLHIVLYANGDFGTANGEYSLKENKIIIRLKASKELEFKYKNTLHYFKKSKDGEYIYDKAL